ncbi:MAG: RNA polymerase sigma-70 factor [Bacteroidales bacterium]
MPEEQKWETFFESIYTQYYTDLCVFAQSFVYDRDESEEIVQSIILKLWEHKENAAEIKSLKSYLYRSVRNTCLNYIKHEKIKHQYQDTSWIKLKEIESNFIDPYQKTELEEHITNAISSLPERCREVFEMSRFDGLKNKEISNQLDISVKAVEANITRALSSLRKKCKEFINSEHTI